MITMIVKGMPRLAAEGLALDLEDDGYQVEVQEEGPMGGHDCTTCVACLHDGFKCCGCHDGACCQGRPSSGAGTDADA